MYMHLHRRSSQESDNEPLYEYDRSIRLAGIKLKKLLAGIFVACCVIGILIALCVVASNIGKDMDKAVTIDVDTSPLVNTSCGDVQGLVDNEVFVFKGIPYAKPPVDDFRWKPTVSLKTDDGCWKGTYPAYNFGPSCYQYHPYHQHEEGSEDCLFINIWTPDLDGLNEVMVYIHGGQLLFGSGSEPDEAPSAELARAAHMVLVSFNYRLGAFGFLALEALTWPSVQGSANYGFGDQIMALQWVKENIMNFGGDPDKVTVFGQGSGATSIMALLSTQESRGLFHRAWLMSPSPRLDKGIQEAKDDNHIFLNVSQCNSADIHQSFNCLHHLDVEDIIRASPLDVFPFWSKSQSMDLPSPNEYLGALAVVDGQLIKQTPAEAWENGNINDVPILIGSVAQEADEHPGPEDIGVWSWDVYDRYVRKKIDALRPNSSTAEQVLQFYPHESGTDPEYQFSSMVSDLRSICPLDNLVTTMSRYFKSPVYRYVVKSSPSTPINHHGFLKRYAFRGWDAMTFLGTNAMYLDTINNSDKKFSKNLRRAVLDFVRNGKINRWRKWTRFPSTTALLGSQVDLVPKYHANQCRFWGQQGFLPGFAWIN